MNPQAVLYVFNIDPIRQIICRPRQSTSCDSPSRYSGPIRKAVASSGAMVTSTAPAVGKEAASQTTGPARDANREER